MNDYLRRPEPQPAEKHLSRVEAYHSALKQYTERVLILTDMLVKQEHLAEELQALEAAIAKAKEQCQAFDDVIGLIRCSYKDKQ